MVRKTRKMRGGGGFLSKAFLGATALTGTQANLRGRSHPQTVESVIKNMKDHVKYGTCKFQRSNLSQFHPDKGGTTKASQKVNAQYNIYKQACSGKRKKTGAERRKERREDSPKEKEEREKQAEEKQREREERQRRERKRKKEEREKQAVKKQREREERQRRERERKKKEREKETITLNPIPAHFFKGHGLYHELQYASRPHTTLYSFLRDGYAAVSLDFQEEYLDAIVLYNKAIKTGRSTGRAWHNTHPNRPKLLDIADMYEKRVNEIKDYLSKRELGGGRRRKNRRKRSTRKKSRIKSKKKTKRRRKRRRQRRKLLVI